MQVSSLINAEGDLAALNLRDCLSNVCGNGAGLRVRHQTTRAQDASNAANLGHLIRGSDSNVEIDVALVDLLDQFSGADDVSASFLSGGSLLALSEDSNANVLTGAVRQGNGAANQLVSLARVNAQAEDNVNGGVEVLGGGLLSQLGGLDRTVQAGLIYQFRSGLISLRLGAHLTIPFLDWCGVRRAVAGPTT